MTLMNFNLSYCHSFDFNKPAVLFGLFIFVFVIIHSLPVWSQTGFTEVSQSIGINHTYGRDFDFMGGGAAFFDFDNDGDLDLYMTGGLRRDVLYRNDGDIFTEVGEQAGLADTGFPQTMGVITGDIDNDGFRDIFVTTKDDSPNLLFKNKGDGTFVNISTTAGNVDTAWSTSASFGDFNLDGLLDIYVVNYIKEQKLIRNNDGDVIGFDHECYPNFLYINDGGGTFSEMAAELGIAQRGCGLATVFTDYDNDSDSDIYIANDFGAYISPNVLFRNDGPDNSSGWKFTNVSSNSGMNAAIFGMGIAMGDYDQNGTFDYYVSNLGRNVLYKNLGDGTFLDVTDEAGVANTNVGTLLSTSWGTAFLDYNNDTYPDLFVCNGYIPAADFLSPSSSDPNKLYKNNGNGTFTDVSSLMGIDNTDIGRGFACGDYDNDGDLDILVMVIAKDPTNKNVSRAHALLYRNNLNNGNHWLKLKLQGTASNRDGFGAHVQIKIDNHSWIRELDGGSSHLSHNSSIAHFGLGQYTHIDSVVVIWPGGKKQVISDVQVDQTIKIIEETTVTTVISTRQFSFPKNFQLFQNHPNPFNPETQIKYNLFTEGYVHIEIFNTLGREIVTIDEGLQNAGEHIVKWNGIDKNGIKAPSGIYIFRLIFQSRNGIQTVESKKMILLR